MTRALSAEPTSLPSLRRNSIWTVAGNLTYAACQWGILVALAKLGSPEMVGQFAIGLAITAPIVMLTNLQLRAVQATDAHEQFSFSTYIGLRLVTTTMALTATVVIALTGGYPAASVMVILLIGTSKSVESISDVAFGLLQRHEQMDRIAISMMAKGVVSLAAVAGVLYVTHSISAAMGALVASCAFVLFTYDIPQAAKVIHPRLEWKPRAFRQLAMVGLPLGIVMLLVSMNTNVPRYFLERLQGQSELGVFAALAYIPVGGNLIVTAVGQAITPRLASYYASHDYRAFIRLLWRFILVAAAAGLAMLGICWLWGGPIISTLYGPAYVREGLLLRICWGGAVGFVGSTLGFGMTAARRFRIQLPIFVVVGCVTVMMCFLLIPRYQLDGAAWALLSASGVQFVLSAGAIVHALKDRPRGGGSA